MTRRATTQAVLLLGGNLGPVADNILRARARLRERAGVELWCSSVRESQAWGFDTPDIFLNQVIILETPLDPLALLDVMQEIEVELGRVRTPTPSGPWIDTTASAAPAPRYLSRTMDIDLLYYGNQQIQNERLTVPHPLIGEREFVQVLLGELPVNFVAGFRSSRG